eukprot:3392319-Prymnesium_polylepis.1
MMKRLSEVQGSSDEMPAAHFSEIKGWVPNGAGNVMAELLYALSGPPSTAAARARTVECCRSTRTAGRTWCATSRRRSSRGWGARTSLSGTSSAPSWSWRSEGWWAAALADTHPHRRPRAPSRAD